MRIGSLALQATAALVVDAPTLPNIQTEITAPKGDRTFTHDKLVSAIKDALEISLKNYHMVFKPLEKALVMPDLLNHLLEKQKALYKQNPELNVKTEISNTISQLTFTPNEMIELIGLKEDEHIKQWLYDHIIKQAEVKVSSLISPQTGIVSDLKKIINDEITKEKDKYFLSESLSTFI